MLLLNEDKGTKEGDGRGTTDAPARLVDEGGGSERANWRLVFGCTLAPSKAERRSQVISQPHVCGAISQSPTFHPVFELAT